MILQDDLTGERLAQEIATLIRNPDEITRREQASKRQAKKDAAATTVALIERMLRSEQ